MNGAGPPRRALWVSTSRQTRGGMTSYLETLAATPLWREWNVRFVATHREGPIGTLAVAFARGLGAFLYELARHRPDVVHLHMAKDASFFRKATLLWIATAARIPVVLHIHAGRFKLFHDRLPRPLRGLVRRTLARAGTVVALGDRWAALLREIAPGARIVALPNPVRIVGPAPRPAEGAPVHVVFLGRIGDGKGSFALLEAWEKVVAGARVPARLTLAGNGEVDRARAVVAARGLGGTVEVRSWLSAPEVADLLGSAQVLTLPSRNEGQPMSILEGMARGMCIVATDVGGIPDLVADGTSAVLVPPDDVDALAEALRSVIDDPALRARLGAAALQRARADFDVDVVWRRFDTLYRELADGTAVPSAS